MKKILSIIVFSIFPLFVFPYNSVNRGEIDEYLLKLDLSIKNKHEYDLKKEDRIQLLNEKLKPQNISLDKKYNLTMMLFEEYSTYKNDSMYACAHKLMDIAKLMNDKNRIVRAQIAIANSHLWAGLFKDAYEYAASIDTTTVSKDLQIDFLMLLFTIEFECALYAKYQHYFNSIYKEKTADLITKLEGLLPKGDERLLEVKQKQCFLAGKLQGAYDIALKRFDYKDETRQQTAAKLGNAGYTALDKGDTITAIKYMVDASILDIELGSRQTPALRMLSQALYPQGYLKESYRYIQLAMDNACFFGSRYRIYEASIMLPTIDKDLYELTKKQKEDLSLAITVIAIFFVALLISIFVITKQNKKLTKSRLLIEKQNKSLLKNNEVIIAINEKLLEANHIKETYLGQILSSNSDYISKLEDLEKTISRKLKVKQYEDISNFINKNNYGKERDKMLKSFDNMFLRLYPDFLEKFNSLLNENDQIIVDEKSSLTPEVRIFALIRLGITKNDTIAEILDYSLSTVKNYKTKIRNSSIVRNEEFEKKLMAIEFAASKTH